jgi:hypothetical protein
VFMNKSRLGICGGLVAFGISVVAAGTATAAAPVFVVSDKVSFAGNATPGPVPGIFVFQSTRCILHSDTEPTAQCQLSAEFSTSSTGAVTGGATLSSPEGTTKWSFIFTHPSASTFLMKGKGTEMDNPDTGRPPPPQYPCKAKGTGSYTPTSSGFSLTGTIVVKELSSQP